MVVPTSAHLVALAPVRGSAVACWSPYEHSIEGARVHWGRWNSAPAVKVRDPTAASGRLTR